MASGFFLQGTRVYPQPVARACGRICRAKNSPEILDATIRSAEILTRYIAALAISSLSARADKSVKVPDPVKDLAGDLSFGHFLSVVQSIAALDVEHPLKPLFSGDFRKDTKGTNADKLLTDLLNLRNREGHDLMSLSEAKAGTILKSQQPLQKLEAVLTLLDRALCLPLFLFEEQDYSEGRFTARRLLLMGEAEPIPQEVELKAGLNHKNSLYVGIRDGALCIDPMLIWEVAESRYCYGLHFIHSIGDKNLKFVSVDKDETIANGDRIKIISELTDGTCSTHEEIKPSSGIDFLKEWLKERSAREKALAQVSCDIPWDSFDKKTLGWYVNRIDSSAAEEQYPSVILKELLDGRLHLSPEEVHQLVLLFGNEDTVREQARRTIVDCRARSDGKSEKRWIERKETSENILECLRAAISFIGRHVGIDGITLDGLDATSGSADYIAIREGLINLFIHQDYSDERAPSQVEISTDQTILFNPGRSLVSNRSLIEGGTSQSRNPIIGRALRRIGFAELAGSGLREVHRSWREAGRRPPRIESNKSANTFTLTLDWRELSVDFDQFWKDKLGVKVNSEQAAILSLLTESGGFSAEEIASNQGLRLSDIEEHLVYLVRQELIEQTKNNYQLKDHLRKLVSEENSK